MRRIPTIRDRVVQTRLVITLLGAALLVGGCSFGGRVHLGDLWLQAGHGLAMVGNHVAIALH
jgi:hypothetical protein